MAELICLAADEGGGNRVAEFDCRERERKKKKKNRVYRWIVTYGDVFLSKILCPIIITHSINIYFVNRFLTNYSLDKCLSHIKYSIKNTRHAPIILIKNRQSLINIKTYKINISHWYVKKTQQMFLTDGYMKLTTYICHCWYIKSAWQIFIIDEYNKKPQETPEKINY